MKVLIWVTACSLSFPALGFGQSIQKPSKAYLTSGAEAILSLARIYQQGAYETPTLRFAPVVNFQVTLNKNMSETFGLFTGFAVRNVGYILSDYADTNNVRYKKKFRSYNIGIPFGFKLGDVDETFFYAGYEVELPLAYKEKTYDAGSKIDNIQGWLSSRQELFQHGFFVGVEFPLGISFKFKRYLSEFHNRDYTNNDGTKPFAAVKANIYYVSLCVFDFKNFDLND